MSTENLSKSRKINKSRKELITATDHKQSDPPTHSTVDIPSEITMIQRARTLHRVPPQLRANKEHIYAPVVFPLGPYYHGLPQFDQVEQLKNEVLNIKLDENGKGLARSEFLKRTQEIRNFYGGVSKCDYDDKTLAEMMLRDASFFVYHMEASTGSQENERHIIHRLGLSGVLFMSRDFFMLENQVPLWAIKLLISLTLFNHDGGKVETFIWKYASRIIREFCELLGEVPWGKGEEQEPLHLIELYRTALIKPPNNSSETTRGSRNGLCGKIFKILKWKSCWDHETRTNWPIFHPFRSVMDLKAKGIQVRPSSQCLTDIRFKSYWFYGKLLLPTFFINNSSKVFFSNLIAFEMSPETDTHFEVISYVNFMQSLIENPKDVKELREKGVLLSNRNDEEVMNIFKELDVYGVDNWFMSKDVKMKIDRHCHSKAKTWMVELVYTYFRTPWSAIGLFSAALLLCLTFLQTIYTKNSAK